VVIDPGAKELVYNLAVLHEKLLHISAARGYYRRYLDLETDGKARARAESAIRRLEGAERELAEVSVPAVAALRLPVAAPAPLHHRADPWLIAPAVFAGTALTVGVLFGAAALANNPGTAPQTRPGVSAEQLAADARTAHGDAVAADVAFGVAAVGAVTLATIVLVRASREPKKVDRGTLGHVAVHAGSVSLGF
jgi:hypothetical protein